MSAAEDLLYQLVELLVGYGEISLEPCSLLTVIRTCWRLALLF